MNKLTTVMIVSVLALTLVLNAGMISSSFAMGKKDAKAKNEIIKNIWRAAEGKWRNIDSVNISKFNSNETITVYNKTNSPIVIAPPAPTNNTGTSTNQTNNTGTGINNTGTGPVIPPVVNNTNTNTNNTTPQLPPCPAGFELDNQDVCIPIQIPGPNNNTTEPTNNTTTTPNATTTQTVCLVGDLSGSTVPNMMKDCNLKVGLGDLGYASDLKYFKGLKFDRCVVGNHDSPEDGSSSIYKEALALCGDHWSQKIGSSTIIIGLNTNGEVSTQLAAVKAILSSGGNVQSVIVVSHKAGHVPPGSHHPAEAATLYKQLEALIPANVKLFEVAGHNHVMSAAPAKNWYESGAGGKSHYTCGTGAPWTQCDDKNFGYLELTVENNGSTSARFVK